MNKSILITVMALMCLPTAMMAKKDKTVTLQFIETTDVHGAFFPYN